jgi:hypothetical protein
MAPARQRLTDALEPNAVHTLSAVVQQSPSETFEPQYVYAAKFLCGPSSESFQEGMVTGYAATAINILNPSLSQPVRFAKRVSRALPYQASGAISDMQEGSIDPLAAMEVECNEIRQMLPSQMTEEFRTGYLLIHSEDLLEVTAVYSARPRDGEISTLHVQRIEASEIEDDTPPGRKPDLTVTDIDMDALRVDCPQGPRSCITGVPVTVANIGATPAAAFRVRVTLDPSQSVVVDHEIAGLAPGASETFDVVTPPGGNCFDPNCQVCAFADSNNTVAESNEGNNELCRERQG